MTPPAPTPTAPTPTASTPTAPAGQTPRDAHDTPRAGYSVHATRSLRRRRGLTEEAAIAAIDQACRRLRLPTVRAVVDEALAVATKEQLTYQGFLAELLLAEVDDRDRRSSARRVKAAGFPRDKWLGDFDFTPVCQGEVRQPVCPVV